MANPDQILRNPELDKEAYRLRQIEHNAKESGLIFSVSAGVSAGIGFIATQNSSENDILRYASVGTGTLFNIYAVASVALVVLSVYTAAKSHFQANNLSSQVNHEVYNHQSSLVQES